MSEVRKQTFGERAVGLTFNPGGNPRVDTLKRMHAATIDVLHSMRTESEDPEVKRMCSLAITALQEAQMWAVKAATWQ